MPDPIRASVRAAFVPWSEPFEGRVNHMYLDTLGLVTTAMGNLIDPVNSALKLPWLRADNSIALGGEIIAEWQAIKGNTALAKQGANAAATYCKLHLSSAGIDLLIQSKLDDDVTLLMTQSAFQDFADWPADAQLGLLSMAWAMGPSFSGDYPMFCAAVSKDDWKTAAAECEMQDAGGGIDRRNEATKLAFTLAINVQLGGIDPNVLQSPVLLA